MYKKFLLVFSLLLNFHGYLCSQYTIKSCLDPIFSSNAKDIVSFNAGMPFSIENIKGDTLLIPGFPYTDIYKEWKGGVDFFELGNNVELWIDNLSKNLCINNSLKDSINIFLVDISGKVFFQTKVGPGSNSINIGNLSDQIIVVACEYQSIIIKSQKFQIR